MAHGNRPRQPRERLRHRRVAQPDIHLRRGRRLPDLLGRGRRGRRAAEPGPRGSPWTRTTTSSSSTASTTGCRGLPGMGATSASGAPTGTGRASSTHLGASTSIARASSTSPTTRTTGRRSSRPTGRYVAQFGSYGSGPGQLTRPSDVAVDPRRRRLRLRLAQQQGPDLRRGGRLLCHPYRRRPAAVHVASEYR